MNNTDQDQKIRLAIFDDLRGWVDNFLIDRESRNLSPNTIRIYANALSIFLTYADTRGIIGVRQVESDDIRGFLLYLKSAGHNPGGISIYYRSLRTFFYYFEAEIEPESWRNPIRRVKAPRVPIEPITPVTFEAVRSILSTCRVDKFTGQRDFALILCLLDTGIRANELLGMMVSDVNLATGEVLITKGKGRKFRVVYLGPESKKALKIYLENRSSENKNLWLRINGDPLNYAGLRQILRRRSALAGVHTPGSHDFRRAFALSMLRSRVDIFTIQRLLGHSDISILRRYLAQTDQDTKEAHMKSSPVGIMLGTGRDFSLEAVNE